MKLDLYILIVTIVTIAVGLLLGLLRGSRRSVLRLLLVLLCVVGAYFLKDVVTSAILKMDIQGQNIELGRLCFRYSSLSLKRVRKNTR